MNARHSVLIIEDDSTLLRGLKDNFESQGYRVRTAVDGRSGLNAALADPPDLIVLDIMLPGMNGYEVCSEVRENDLEFPIIMLTAKGQEEDIIRGLNLGADDYVTKPFNIRELLARAGAFLRRYPRAESEVFCFGDCKLDVSSHQLFKAGQEIALTTKEFRLLEYFVRRPGRALARNDIMDSVWGSSVIVTARSVDRCVATLRAKVEPNAHRPRYIQTIRDIGYRFEIPAVDPAAADSVADNTIDKATNDSVDGAESPAGELAPGDLLGRYTIESLLGRGGTARVYQAKDMRLDRTVALKVLGAASARDADLLRRFERETRAIAALSHPNIRTIYDAAHDKGVHFAVMEYLEGETLRDRIQQAFLDASQAVSIARDVTLGLSAAHQKGIVHRDIKPANIFLTTDGRTKVLDFGLAYLASSATPALAQASSTETSPGRVLGTVNYMSPEQARGQETDARSDIFSLGAVLHEMLTGTAPFARKTAIDTIAAILHDEPRDLPRGVSENLEAIVGRCLRKDLTSRYQTAAELCDDLAALTAKR